MKTVILISAALAALASSASAMTIVPVSATASSSFPGYPAADAIDTGAGAATSDWASNGQGAGSTLQLDLGAVYKLASATVTDRVTSGGPNNAFYGGSSDFTTSYSLTAYTDATYTTAIGAPVIVSNSYPNFTTTPSLGNVSAEFVEYTVLASNGANPGLSNIDFTGSVPEPTTWVLMVAGFGLVGASLRHRGRVAAA